MGQDDGATEGPCRIGIRERRTQVPAPRLHGLRPRTPGRAGGTAARPRDDGAPAGTRHRPGQGRRLPLQALRRARHRPGHRSESTRSAASAAPPSTRAASARTSTRPRASSARSRSRYASPRRRRANDCTFYAPAKTFDLTGSRGARHARRRPLRLRRAVQEVTCARSRARHPERARDPLLALETPQQAFPTRAAGVGSRPPAERTERPLAARSSGSAALPSPALRSARF